MLFNTYKMHLEDKTWVWYLYISLTFIERLFWQDMDEIYNLIPDTHHWSFIRSERKCKNNLVNIFTNIMSAFNYKCMATDISRLCAEGLRSECLLNHCTSFRLGQTCQNKILRGATSAFAVCSKKAQKNSNSQPLGPCPNPCLSIEPHLFMSAESESVLIIGLCLLE